MSEVEPRVYISKRTGLGLTITPETKEWDGERKKEVVIPGIYVKFVDGKYVATTQEEIDFLEAYSKKKSGEVFPISKKSEKLAKAIKKVDEEEAEAKSKKKKGQGVFGRKVTADPTDGKGKSGQGSRG